jgi:NADH-quinone oxidoreductase subunit G
MRVVPLENEAVNECWIADRDRFSYEALNGPERLLKPMIKQGGDWQEVDWQVALEYVATGLKQIKADHGAATIGALVSPHSTLEELALAGALVRGLGSENIDYRLRHAEFARYSAVRWLGMPIAELTQLQRVLVVGSNLRKDHPLFAQRIRQAVRHGAQVSRIDARASDWAMPVAHSRLVDATGWTQALADVATAVAVEKDVTAPATGTASDAATAIARSLLGGERKAILLGNAACHHARAESLLALANWIGEQTGARVGVLTEAANTVGAQLAGAMPGEGGQHAGQMLAGGLKAALLLNTEPVDDSAAGTAAVAALGAAAMVVTLSPFKANMDFSDVLLPIAPFTETSGSFVNAEGRLQGFHAVVKPAGEARPAWKVLRVLANMLGLDGFEQESSREVLALVDLAQVDNGALVGADKLGNQTSATIDTASTGGEPCVASIYQLDSLVRRAGSLQLTADARQGAGMSAAQAEALA